MQRIFAKPLEEAIFPPPGTFSDTLEAQGFSMLNSDIAARRTDAISRGVGVTTQVYAERDLAKGIEVAKRIG